MHRQLILNVAMVGQITEPEIVNAPLNNKKEMLYTQNKYTVFSNQVKPLSGRNGHQPCNQPKKMNHR